MLDLGRWLFFIGVGIAFLGLIVYVLARFFPWLGNLPGDLRFESENVKVYIPLATMLLVSIVGTIILNLLIRFFRR